MSLKYVWLPYFPATVELHSVQPNTCCSYFVPEVLPVEQ